MCRHEVYNEDCMDCSRMFNQLQRWNYSRSPEFTARSHSKRFFGVELEMEVNWRDEPEYVQRVVRGQLTRAWHCMEDGSLNNGIEFVSMPLTLLQWTDGSKFTKWMKSLPGTVGIGQDCGMHIHVCRKSFKYPMDDVGKINYFVNSCQYQLEDLAGRKWETKHDGNWRQYCRPSEPRFRSTGSDKYKALNLRNDNTIEFRFPEGTTKPAQVRKMVSLIAAICELVPEFTKDQLRGSDGSVWGMFLMKVATDKRFRTNSYILRLLKEKSFWSEELETARNESMGKE